MTQEGANRLSELGDRQRHGEQASTPPEVSQNSAQRLPARLANCRQKLNLRMFFQTADKLFDIGLENGTAAEHHDPNRFTIVMRPCIHAENIPLQE